MLQKLIVDVRVQDLERAVVFYRDVLGLVLIHQDKTWASFEAMGAEMHLYLHDGVQRGVEFRVDDLAATVEVLEKKGVTFFLDQEQKDVLRVEKNLMEFAWGKAAFFHDSEGNHLALLEDAN